MDGDIADKNVRVGWLDDAPNPDNDDMDYKAFMSAIDSILRSSGFGFCIRYRFK